MIDMKLHHRRARRFYPANFNFTLAKASLKDSRNITAEQQQLVKAPLTGKIALLLFCIALVMIQLI